MSMIFALVAIISSSQQLWILPRLDLGTLNSIHERQRRIDDVSAFVSRVQKTDGHGNLKARYVFALQAPIMLLTFSVLLFLAGLCSTVCSPLARKLEWNSDAKVSWNLHSLMMLTGVTRSPFCSGLRALLLWLYLLVHRHSYTHYSDLLR
jgi:hypothetical protein